MQFVARWYLFGKCTFRTFSYFGLRRGTRDSRTLSVGFLFLSVIGNIQAVPPNKKWRISNEIISLIHSIVSGLWAGYVLLFYTEFTKDMVNYRVDVAVNLVCVLIASEIIMWLSFSCLPGISSTISWISWLTNSLHVSWSSYSIT